MLKYLSLLLFAASAVAQPFPARPGPVIISQPSTGGSSSGGVDTNAVIALIEEYATGGGVVSNVTGLTLSLETRYTNDTAYYAYVSASVALTTTASGSDTAAVAIKIDESANGSYEYIAHQVAQQGRAATALSYTSELGATVPPGAAFIYDGTVAAGGGVDIPLGSGQIVYFGSGTNGGGGISSATATNIAAYQAYLATNGFTGGVSAAQVAAIMATNSSLQLQTTNARVYATGFEPSSGATYGPNIRFGGTNAVIVGTESHSSFVMGGRHGSGYQNIISNGLWCVINGGYGNRIIGDDESAGNSTISGGELNNMVGLFSMGGYNSFNTIGGGEIHAMGNPDGSTFMLNSTISGGRGNKITGTNGSYVFIGGGGDSTGGDNIGHVVHNGDFSIIPGGRDNKITNATAAAIGWDLVVTNNYEVKIGYSNNAASVRSNGTLVAVSFSGAGNGITAINADNIETGTIPRALFNGVYDQDLFFTSANNIFFADEMHAADYGFDPATSLNNLPTGKEGYLLNSNKVLYWITSTKTNLVSDGR